MITVRSFPAHAWIKTEDEQIVMRRLWHQAKSWTRSATFSASGPARIRRSSGGLFWFFHGGNFPPATGLWAKKKPLRCETGGAKVVLTIRTLPAHMRRIRRIRQWRKCHLILRGSFYRRGSLLIERESDRLSVVQRFFVGRDAAGFCASFDWAGSARSNLFYG